MGWTENENSSEVKDAEKPAENKKESMLPCLMIMCGSGCGFLKVRHLLKSERKKNHCTLSSEKCFCRTKDIFPNEQNW